MIFLVCLYYVFLKVFGCCFLLYVIFEEGSLLGGIKGGRVGWEGKVVVLCTINNLFLDDFFYFSKIF